ncbi:MAG TPA: hypothetical protein VGA61_10520, partial [Anaerolineae bacterium]
AAPDSRTVSASDTSKYFGSQPALTLDKRTNGGDGLSISVGAALTWTYVVTNTGNVELTSVTVTDNKLTAAEIHCGGASGTNVIAKLAPGGHETCTAAGVAVLGLYENLGTASGTPPVGAAVTATDASSYTGIENKHYLFLPMLRR